MENTTFGSLPSLSYFVFEDESEEVEHPKDIYSDHWLLCNNWTIRLGTRNARIWEKCSSQKILKVGEDKESSLLFKKLMTSVVLVAKDLTGLIEADPDITLPPHRNRDT